MKLSLKMPDGEMGAGMRPWKGCSAQQDRATLAWLNCDSQILHGA